MIENTILEQAGTGRMLLHRQNIGIEKSVDLLEEVSHTADRELAVANLSRCSGLLRNLRAALARIADDTFGACLCCGMTIGSEMSKGGTLDSFVHQVVRRRPTAMMWGLSISFMRLTPVLRECRHGGEFES